MKNPWEAIPLEDYEAHMSLDSVLQLQTMNAIMRSQFAAFPASSVMILGVAGGNGLEHIPNGRFQHVYAVDINPRYLEEAARRYPGAAEYLRADLRDGGVSLPEAELVIANLLVEYIGCPCFRRVLDRVRARFASCVLQVDLPGRWVSDSLYLHAFDGLDAIHRPVGERALAEALPAFRPLGRWEFPLPNGKKLLRADFGRRVNQEEPS